MKKWLLIFFLFSMSMRADYPPALHYAFANYLGSGFYNVKGQDAFLLKLPFSYSFDDKDTGLKLRLPVNVGFYDWSFSDNELPDSVNMASFIPGVEYIFQINERWSASPFFDLGYARDFENTEDTVVYALGGYGVYKFGESLQHSWISRFVHVKARSESDNSEDQLTYIQSGLDLDTGIGARLLGRDFTFTTYGMGRLYLNNFGLESEQFKEDVELTKTYEVGASIKFREKIKASFFEIGQIGFGYQFGDGFDLYKVFVNLPI